MADFFHALSFMAPAVVMYVILVLLCGYVGMHVVMREVIFIDIALAQVAALGATMGMYLGLELGNPWTYVLSLGFTLLGAALLSGTRRLSSLAPQEAFIGILYVTAAAAVILVGSGDKISDPEHVKELMAGPIFVLWKDVGLHAVVYVGLAVAYLFSHQKLLQISRDPAEAKHKGVRLVLWDFIFYAILGVLVTFAVRVAGVLLVFGFLIVPAVIGSLYGKSFFGRLSIAWIAGIVIVLLSTIVYIPLDFPPGGTLVVCLGVVLLVLTVIRGVGLKMKHG
ncbi:MAG: metal ABC transporter permease [bacterium]